MKNLISVVIMLGMVLMVSGANAQGNLENPLELRAYDYLVRVAQPIDDFGGIMGGYPTTKAKLKDVLDGYGLPKPIRASEFPGINFYSVHLTKDKVVLLAFHEKADYGYVMTMPRQEGSKISFQWIPHDEIAPWYNSNVTSK